MARNMEDLLLLDSILRDSNATTRGNGALPAPGVSCAAPVDRNMSQHTPCHLLWGCSTNS